jgi:predicted AAA+ superfamily ATPase
MPWITKKALAELSASMKRLRHDVKAANADNAALAARATAEQRRADTAEAALVTTREAVTAGHRELLRRLDDLTRENGRLTRDRDGLRQQLNHALGYGATELAAIEAGKTKPRETAAAK